MSEETMDSLNVNTLIGFTSKRGTAWHYRESLQGDEPNHYELAIPEADVVRRLFNWTILEGTYETTYKVFQGVDPETSKEIWVKKHTSDPTKKNLIRSDTGKILYGFKRGYQVHDYNQWLVQNLHHLIADGTMEIGSAGLLRDGAQAWVQIEMPDNVESYGVERRPFLCAATSADGSMASTYFTGSQLVVCDNTLRAGVQGADDIVRYRHSSHSLGRIKDVQTALRLLHQENEAFDAELKKLVETTVTEMQWDQFLDLHVPNRDENGELKTGRALTLADKHRDELNLLWTKDERVAPWNGTAFGVLQAINTYDHHIAGVRGMSRAERNADKNIFGVFAENDEKAMAQLELVLAA